MYFMTLTDLAQRAKEGGRSVSTTYLRRLLRDGVIAGTKYGRVWLVGEPEAERWLAKWLKNVDK